MHDEKLMGFLNFEYLTEAFVTKLEDYVGQRNNIEKGSLFYTNYN